MELSNEQAAGLKPLGNRILVKRFEEKQVGSIIIPDLYRDFSRYAQVVSVGPSVDGVKAGDVVFLPGIALSQPDWESGGYAMVTVDDVGGIIEEQGRA